MFTDVFHPIWLTLSYFIKKDGQIAQFLDLHLSLDIDFFVCSSLVISYLTGDDMGQGEPVTYPWTKSNLYILKYE